jgi:hypothetical protein
MEVFLNILFIVGLLLVLGGALYLLHRSDVRTKNKHKMTAYNLLEKKDADPKKIKETIKLLRLYGGRWRKDPEIISLAGLLSDMLNEIEKSGAPPGKQVKK